MKIILDNIIFSLQKSGGISVYWSEIVNRISKQKNISCSFIEEEIKNENIFRRQLEINADNLLQKNIFNFCFSRYRKINLSLKNTKFIFHSSYYRTLSKKTKKNNDVKEIVTIHDFTYEYFNSGVKKWIHSRQKREAIKAADVVICISENTKKDLLHFFPEFNDKKIKVIYNGVSKDYFVIPKISFENIKKPYFVFVGSRSSYKNFDFAVKAVAQIKNFNLKIVGSKLSKEEITLLNCFLSGRWELLTNIDNIELNVIYNNAYALLYPSAYEGFGIPLLEAMKAGCPFIALNVSSIPEVAGKAGVLLDKLTINQFNDAIDKLNNDYQNIVELGLIQASAFSWDKCYDEILNVYKEINN